MERGDLIDWGKRADRLQTELISAYWDDKHGIMRQELGKEINRDHPLIYWWHAHVIDVLIDGYERDKAKGSYIERIDTVLDSVIRLNGNTILNDYYDDMEWMALALLRLYDVTGQKRYLELVRELWSDIKGAWNDICGGGLAWRKFQLDYKNTPANAPAAILAARLYQRFSDPEDLWWAIRIYNWNTEHLVDPLTGFVWDGINRLGDGMIDLDWKYTYCQGVYIGAALELYRITREKSFLDAAIRTAICSHRVFTTSGDQILGDEGADDCGLFKGIYVRYLYDLYTETNDQDWIKGFLYENAASLWDTARDEQGIISRSWKACGTGKSQLCAQLSGVMLMEMVARNVLQVDTA